MGEKYHFDEDYREEVELTDGSKAVLRTVRPSDKELLQRGFDRLSPESRYLRFFGAKTRLSEQDLRYLTEVDGVNHFALGALRPHLVREDEGLSIARFVRLADEATVAEPAVTVVDEVQGKGLGTLMVLRLAAAARERGIERFRSEFLARNERMRSLVKSLASEVSHGVELQYLGDVIRAEFPLMPFDPGALPGREVRKGPIRRMLAHVARDLVAVRLRLSHPAEHEAGEGEGGQPENDEGE